MPQIRVWARPDMYEQTAYALNFSEKAYQFFSEYFGTPEMVSKAGNNNKHGMGVCGWPVGPVTAIQDFIKEVRLLR